MKKIPKLIFTVGLQCSGKTTWAKDVCEKDSNHFRVSLDDLRLMRGKYWHPADEDLIENSALSIVCNALRAGKSVIFDAMNLNAEKRTYFANRAQEVLDLADEGLTFSVITKSFLDVPITELLKRAAARVDERGITPQVIIETYMRNKDRLPALIPTQNDRLPKAIIVDIDGTIADKGERNPYNWSKVGEDTPHLDIIKLVEMLADYKDVIFMSGRSIICHAETRSWIKEHTNLTNFELLMRSKDDNRKDDIVKLELYLNFVAGQYNVDYVIDDRDQVVKMWRNVLGLRCLQVAEGNF